MKPDKIMAIKYCELLGLETTGLYIEMYILLFCGQKDSNLVRICNSFMFVTIVNYARRDSSVKVDLSTLTTLAHGTSSAWSLVFDGEDHHLHNMRVLFYIFFNERRSKFCFLKFASRPTLYPIPPDDLQNLFDRSRLHDLYQPEETRTSAGSFKYPLK